MSDDIKPRRVVIAGGGTAGWVAATAIVRQLGALVDVTLVESEEIGTVGVGESTIPTVRTFHNFAGIDEDARDAIAAQIADGTITVDATHASRDWTAGLGRTDMLSEHPVNPIDVPGVTEFSSEHGTVWFGDMNNLRMEHGEQVGGHGAHDHNPWYELWRHQTGYLSTDSTAYLTALERLASSYGE